MLEPNATSIQLADLDKSYGDTEVLDGIDLKVKAGEFLVLVGPSGCGKSTLLRCVAGLEDITDGELRIGGQVSNDVKPKDRDLAMVFQSYALYPHMTVRENVGFSLTVRNIDDAEIAQRVERAVERLGIEELLDRYPEELSGGQRQRVAVGRAIVRNPKAFLLDEPLSNLDAALRSQMRLELKKLHRDLGATMVYVTHDQVEAMTLADRIAILDDGELQQVGTPREVYDRPANRFVAGFIGSPSMNFLEAQRRGDSVSGRGFELALSDRLRGDGADRPEKSDQNPVDVGVRPAALRLEADAPAGTVRGAVDVVEPLGSEAYLHATLEDDPDHEIVAEVPADEALALDPGDPVQFGVETEDVHVFDRETGEAW